MSLIRKGVFRGEMIGENEWIIDLIIELPESNHLGKEMLEFSGTFKAK
jgi:hypothetical protein